MKAKDDLCQGLRFFCKHLTLTGAVSALSWLGGATSGQDRKSETLEVGFYRPLRPAIWTHPRTFV
jgi:hypothetical protein